MWAVGGLRDGARVLRPSAPVAVFSADDMRAEWVPRWKPAAIGKKRPPADATWRVMAARAGMVEQPQTALVPPSFEVMKQAIKDTAGPAGLDGWEAKKNSLLQRTTRLL